MMFGRWPPPFCKTTRRFVPTNAVRTAVSAQKADPLASAFLLKKCFLYVIHTTQLNHERPNKKATTPDECHVLLLGHVPKMDLESNFIIDISLYQIA